MNLGSDMEPQGAGSWNLEYRFLSIASAGIKLAGQTDFKDNYSVIPTAFTRLYPFSGAFAEASLGGRFSWTDKIFTKNLTIGGSVGWRISSGKTYIEPKLNFDYAFGADKPFSWSGGVGAGYSF